MAEVNISVNDETVKLTGKAAEDFEKDRAAQHSEFIKLQAEQKAAQAANEAKKQEVLTKLGLTADEVTALLA
jgi:hypothetical protein